jgi:hypothetical protein
MVSAPLSLGLSSLTADTIDVIQAPDFEAAGFRVAMLTAPEIAIATHQEAVSKARYERYVLYHDYHEGRQRDPRSLTFTDDDTSRDRTFRAPHNVCAPIIDIPTERLTVTGFSATTPDGERLAATDDLAALLWRWWQASRLDALARIIHRHTFKFGDAFLMVEWDNERGRPRYCLEDPRQVTPVYDGNGVPVVTYKAWAETPAGEISGGATRERLRINKYEPGLLQKFVSINGGLSFTYWTEDRYPDGTPDGGIVPWVDRKGLPLPIPIVHFRNQADGADFGRSELADTVPMQDEFNRRVWATGQAAVFDGARIKYGINIEPMRNPSTGDEQSPPIGPNVFWYLNPKDPEKAAQVATLDTGDLGQLQEVADRELKTIAGLMGIPMHLIWPAGGLPSGESLKTAEARLVSKLEDRAVTLGNSWEDACYLAVRLASAYGGLTLPEDVLLTTEWAPIASRSELAEEQVIDLRKDDLSRRQRMRERGYSEEEIDRIEAEREDEKEAEPPPPAPVVVAGAEDVDMTESGPEQAEEEAA